MSSVVVNKKLEDDLWKDVAKAMKTKNSKFPYALRENAILFHLKLKNLGKHFNFLSTNGQF